MVGVAMENYMDYRYGKLKEKQMEGNCLCVQRKKESKQKVEQSHLSIIF